MPFTNLIESMSSEQSALPQHVVAFDVSTLQDAKLTTLRVLSTYCATTLAFTVAILTMVDAMSLVLNVILNICLASIGWFVAMRFQCVDAKSAKAYHELKEEMANNHKEMANNHKEMLELFHQSKAEKQITMVSISAAREKILDAIVDQIVDNDLQKMSPTNGLEMMRSNELYAQRALEMRVQLPEPHGKRTTTGPSLLDHFLAIGNEDEVTNVLSYPWVQPALSEKAVIALAHRIPLGKVVTWDQAAQLRVLFRRNDIQVSKESLAIVDANCAAKWVTLFRN
jgi:hypothetical protein